MDFSCRDSRMISSYLLLYYIFFLEAIGVNIITANENLSNLLNLFHATS